jgi:hypothetical protein
MRAVLRVAAVWKAPVLLLRRERRYLPATLRQRSVQPSVLQEGCPLGWSPRSAPRLAQLSICWVLG